MRRTMWLLVAGLVSAGSADGQEPGRTPMDGPARVDVPSAGTAVPLERQGQFYSAAVSIGGRPFHFTIETGASFFAVTEGAVRALGLTPDTAATGFRFPVVRIQSLRIGDAVFHDVVAGVLPSCPQTPDCDGLISVPLLRSVVATFDFPGRQLRISNTPLTAASAVAIAPPQPGERVTVPLALGDTVVDATLDTRSGFGVIVPDSLLPHLRALGEAGETIRARGPSLGDFTLRPIRLADRLEFGGHAIENPTVFVRNRPGVLLGIPLLEQLVVTLDLRRGRVDFTLPAGARLSLDPAAQGAEVRPRRAAAPGQGPPPVYLGFGLIPQPDGGKTVVAVAEGSSAAREGLRDGDQIVSIDGMAAASVNPDVMRAAAAKGVAITVIVLREGRQLEFHVLPHARP